MSNLSGSDLSGSGSGGSDLGSTLSDASLGDQMMGGDGGLGAGAGNASAFAPAGNDFSSFNDIATALSGGGAGSSPTGAQAAAMTPPAAAQATGGDPAGASGGTQSNTTPGSTPTSTSSTQNGQSSNGTRRDPDYAPPQAVDQLKALLKQLTGKPTGPSGPVAAPPAPSSLPALVAGLTGAQSPQGRPPLEGGVANLPELSAGQTGPQSTGSFYGTSVQPKPPTPTGDGQDGGDMTVPKTMEQPGQPPQPQPDLPTHKPSEAPPVGPGTSNIIRDVSGISTGNPTGLADLAQMAKIIIPMLPMLAGLFGGGGRGGRFGGFHGGRFTHGIGGFGHLHGGQHPAGRGAWPYHHPQFGWHMHGRPPGPGWLPLHPMDAQGLPGVGAQPGQAPNQDPNAPDPNRPPKQGGAGGGTYSDPKPGPWSGNPVYKTLVGAESGGRNDGASGEPEGGDGGVARGYFNIQTPTWGDFAQKVPGASRFQSADQAPYEMQRAVANTIPVARFGKRTRDILHAKFGNFDDKMTVGQLADKGSNMSKAARLPPPQLPPASLPTVASQ